MFSKPDKPAVPAVEAQVPSGREPEPSDRDASYGDTPYERGAEPGHRGSPEVLRIFIGWDSRVPLSYTVLAHSLIAYASRPLAITPLVYNTLPVQRTGLTPFTFTRFLVPWLCDYKGYALFMDGDFFCRADVAEVFDYAQCDPVECAVWTVPKKERFEQGAFLLFNCGHPDNRILTPEYVETTKTGLLVLKWTNAIGHLPAEWHHLVLYDKPNPAAKMVHFTAGIPAFPEVHGCEFTPEYTMALRSAVSVGNWNEIMGPSVHVEKVLQFRGLQSETTKPERGNGDEPPSS